MQLTCRLSPENFLYRFQHPPPDRCPVKIGDIKQLVSPHGGVNGGFVAVLVDEDFGGAVDVEVGHQGYVRRSPCPKLNGAQHDKSDHEQPQNNPTTSLDFPSWFR